MSTPPTRRNGPAILSGTWSDVREPPREVLAARYPEIDSRVIFTSYRTSLYALASLFELLSGARPEFKAFAHETDSMGGSDTTLELGGGGASLRLRAVYRLSESWQRAEREDFSFSFDCPGGPTWELDAELASPASLRLTLSGLAESLAEEAEALLAACFGDLRRDIGLEAVENEIHRLSMGGYDEYHEWNPDCSFAEKLSSLDAMLGRWYSTDQAGRDRLRDYARQLLAEDRPWPGYAAGIALRHRGIPAVSALIEASFESAAFCRDLLTAARDSGDLPLPPGWLGAIRDRVLRRQFVKEPGFVNAKHLAREVAGLVNGLSGRA